MQEEQFIRIDKFGNKYYHKDKEMKILHRLDGPAVECLNGFKSWYVDDKRHRLDGPALEYATGYKEWYVDGKELTEKQFLALTQPKELTLQEIAEKFNIPVGQLRIKD